MDNETGVFTTEYSKTIHKKFKINGHLMRRYIYPKINREFSSPYFNDENLSLCGGFSYEPLFPSLPSYPEIHRVMNFKKPMGESIFTGKKMGWHDLFKAVPSLRPLSDSAKFKKSLTHKNRAYGIINFFLIANKMKFSKMFNITDFINDYREYFKVAGLEDDFEDNILDNLSPVLKSGSSADFTDYDFANPSSNFELILSGLILGYPIESTFAIIWERAK
jgi:hypothetical protein